MKTNNNLQQEWDKQFESWLSSPRHRNPNTQRAYRKAWELLLEYTHKSYWEINKSDVSNWCISLKNSGLSDCTISQRITAISSFYKFTIEETEIILENGTRQPFHLYNPASGNSLRPEIFPYGKVEGLTLEQSLHLIKAIPTNTLQGLRDSSLFRFYLATGRRNSEIRTLQKKNIREMGNNFIQYYWQQKHGHGWDELPQDIWKDIQKYLVLSGRPWESLKDDDYIFVAISNAASRFPSMKKRNYTKQNQPLSMRTVGCLLKKYARRADLDWHKIHVHTLRHTCADMMLETGFDIRDVQERLGHKNLNTTQIYMTQKNHKKNEFWAQFSSTNNI